MCYLKKLDDQEKLFLRVKQPNASKISKIRLTPTKPYFSRQHFAIFIFNISDVLNFYYIIQFSLNIIISIYYQYLKHTKLIST